MTANTVKIIIRRSKLMSINKYIKKMGRKTKALSENHIDLLNYVQEHNKLPLYGIATQYRTHNGQKISKCTIKRCLHRNGIRNHVATFKPFLSEKHVSAHLLWCSIRQQCTTKQWRTAVFSDESFSHCVLLRIVYMHRERLEHVTILTTSYLLLNLVMHPHVYGGYFLVMDAVAIMAIRGR